MSVSGTMRAVAAIGEEHWEQVYRSRRPDEVSWYEASPDVSLRLVASLAPDPVAFVDVGGGASLLADRLVAADWTDLTVLDVSGRALDLVRRRLAARAAAVTLVRADVLDWQPDRTFDLWHDRAVFHFLTAAGARSRYLRTAELAIPPGGAVVVATFAPDGPPRCSGLAVRRYDVDGLRAELGDRFELVHGERVEHVTPGGATQPFTWVVARRR